MNNYVFLRNIFEDSKSFFMKIAATFLLVAVYEDFSFLNFITKVKEYTFEQITSNKKLNIIGNNVRINKISYRGCPKSMKF